jgi:hypothetical protein
MQHFVSFSNSARKSFTRQKQATLLGQGAPSTSYVDQIQTARRGQSTPIDSPYYISRNEAMTHPQDNEVLVSAQRKLAKLGQGYKNEHGVKLGRPVGKDANYRNGRLVVGNIVEGDKKGMSLSKSQIKYGGRYMHKDYIGNIHTHPTSPKNQLATVPSIADLRLDFNNRQDYSVRRDDPRASSKPFESLILSTPAGRRAKTSVISYKQTKELPYGLDNFKDAYKQDRSDIDRQIKELGGQYSVY